MKKLFALAFILLSPLSLLPSAAQAALTPQDQADLSRVEAYMNALPPVTAEFIQQTSDGQVFNGQFWLQRPGRLRFEYKNPVNNFVVADGGFIHFWDAKIKKQTSAPIGETLADFILKNRIQFNDGVDVTGVTRKDGLLMVTLVQATDPSAGSLTLVFENMPMQLKQWTVSDAMGLTSTVSLINPAAAPKFDQRLFQFRKP